MAEVLTMLLAAVCAGLLVGSPAGERARLGAGRRSRGWPSFGARADAMPPRRRSLIGIGVGGATAVLAGDLGVVLAICAGTGVGLAVAVSLGWFEPVSVRKRAARISTDLPQVCDLLAAALAAGLPLRRAVAMVGPAIGGPIADVLAGVTRRIELGVGDADAWASLRRHPQLGRLAADLARSVDSGVVLTDLLRQHALDARRSAEGLHEARAKRVGVSSVLPLMICFLPAFFLVGVVPILGGVADRLLKGM